MPSALWIRIIKIRSNSSIDFAISLMKGDSSRPSKRLLFDRRYGWIVDEWKDPAEEALAGGRGIESVTENSRLGIPGFCVLPIAKSLVKLSSSMVESMVNYGLDSANRFLKNSDQTSLTAENADKSIGLVK